MATVLKVMKVVCENGMTKSQSSNGKTGCWGDAYKYCLRMPQKEDGLELGCKLDLRIKVNI